MKKVILLSCLLFCCGIANAQTINEIDSAIAHYISQVQLWSSPKYEAGRMDDSLSLTNDSLRFYIEKVAIKDPGILNAELPKASKALTITASADNNLRIYSWDTWLSEQRRFYKTVAQYRSTNGIVSCEIKDPTQYDQGNIYENITVIRTKNKKSVYVVEGQSILSPKDRGVCLTAYIIEESVIKPFDLFRTNAMPQSSISYKYDEFANWDENKLKSLPIIHYSKNNKRLYIPIVAGEFGEEVINKYLVYVFDGNQFVFDKKAK